MAVIAICSAKTYICPMRTLELIKALSDSEVKEVERLLSGGKREGLLRLFKELKKYASKTEKPSHEELFSRVMDEPYKKDKDYLLRNRMRQVNEVLYEYLAVETFRQTISSDLTTFHYWLSKAYYDRRQKGLFESDIDEFISEATAEITRSPTNLPDAGSNMYALKTLWMINHEPRIPENTENQIAVIDEWMAELKRRTLYKVREIEARKAFLEMLLLHMKNTEPSGRSEGLAALDLTGPQSDWFARYLVLKKHVYQTTGIDKIAVLEEMLQIGDIPEHRAILGLSDATTNMTNLATELITAGNYERGNETLERLLLLCKKEQVQVPIAAIQSYIANQINRGQYEKGLQAYKLYHKEVTGSRSARGIAILASYLWLLLGREEDAIQQLPDSSELSAQHQIHHRFVYLISFIIRQDYDLARTEAGNLRRQIKRTPDIDPTLHLSIMGLYDKYLKALSAPKPEREKGMALLMHTIESEIKYWQQIAIREIPLRWLMVQLKIKAA